MTEQNVQTDRAAAPDLKVSEVAARLGASTATIKRLIRAGTIRGYQLGTQWRIPASEVDRIRQARS